MLCEWCETNETPRTNRFCGASCRSKYARSKQDVSGKKNPNWKHGKCKDYKTYHHHTLEWRKNNPGAKDAHSKVYYALKTGKLTKTPCSHCGNKKVEAHHEDYSKPLDVIWLCRSCHRMHHKHN